MYMHTIKIIANCMVLSHKQKKKKKKKNSRDIMKTFYQFLMILGSSWIGAQIVYSIHEMRHLFIFKSLFLCSLLPATQTFNISQRAKYQHMRQAGKLPYTCLLLSWRNRISQERQCSMLRITKIK